MAEAQEQDSICGDNWGEKQGGLKRSSTKSGEPPAKRIKLDGMILCRFIGGTSRLEHTSFLCKFDRKADNAKLLEPIWKGEQSMFTAIVVLNDAVYSLGGHRFVGPTTPVASSFASVLYTSTAANPVEHRRICKMKMPRANPKAVALGEENKIYVFGGFKTIFFVRDFKDEEWAEFYDSRWDQWMLLPPIKLANGSEKSLYSILNPNPKEGDEGNLELVADDLPALGDYYFELFKDLGSVDYDPETRTLFGACGYRGDIFAYSFKAGGRMLRNSTSICPFYQGQGREIDYAGRNDDWQPQFLVRGSAAGGHINLVWYANFIYTGLTRFFYSRSIKFSIDDEKGELEGEIMPDSVVIIPNIGLLVDALMM